MGQAFRRQAQGDSGSYPPEDVDLLRKQEPGYPLAFPVMRAMAARDTREKEREKIKRPPGFHFRRHPKHDRAGQVVFIKTENLSFFRPWKTEDRGRGYKKAAALSWIKAAHEYFRL